MVAPPPVPVNTGLPTVTGNAVQGQKLTLTPGAWSNSPTGVSDQWQDCDSTGTICTSILGATGPTYTLTSKDLGSTIEGPGNRGEHRRPLQPPPTQRRPRWSPRRRCR